MSADFAARGLALAARRSPVTRALADAVRTLGFYPQPQTRCPANDIPALALGAAGAASALNGRTLGNPLLLLTDPKIKWLAGPATLDGSGAWMPRGAWYGTGRASQYASFEFIHSGNDLELCVVGSFASAVSNLRVLVNERIAALTTVPFNTGSFYYLRLTFPASATRRIRIESAGGKIRGVNVANANEIAATGRSYPCIAVMGDSFPEATGANPAMDGEGSALVREVHNFDRLRHWRRRFAVRDGQYLYAFGPAGLLARARAYASPRLTIGVGQQLTGFYLGRSGDNGSNIADGSARQLEAGKDVAIPCSGGLVGGTQWHLRNAPFAILCQTSTGAGLDTANEFVEFEGWFAELRDQDVPLSEAAFRGAGNEREVFEALFPAFDLPTIAGGASLTVDLAVPDMAASDFIEAVRITGGFAGLELRGAEALAGQVRLTIANLGTAPIDRAAADLAIAFSHPASGT